MSHTNMLAALNWRFKNVLLAIGWPGWAGLAILGLCSAAYYSMNVPAARDISAIKNDIKVLRSSARNALTAKAAPNSAEQLQQFYAFFPEQEVMSERIERVYGAAAQQGVSLEHGDYQLVHEQGGKLVRYELSFPVKGTYVSVRKFIAQVLNDVPSIALDRVTFSRQRISDPLIDAQLKFVLYMRPL